MDTLSLGGGLSYFDGNFASKVELFTSVEQTLPNGPFGENAYVEDESSASSS